MNICLMFVKTVLSVWLGMSNVQVLPLIGLIWGTVHLAISTSPSVTMSDKPVSSGCWKSASTKTTVFVAMVCAISKFYSTIEKKFLNRQKGWIGNCKWNWYKINVLSMHFFQRSEFGHCSSHPNPIQWSSIDLGYLVR